MLHGFVEGIELVAAVVLVAVLGLVVLAARRRWLARQGGTFECSLRLDTATPGSGWVLGIARYHDGLLQWFRFFSYDWRPRKEFVRSGVRVLETREPTSVEAVSLYAEQRVVRFEVTGPDDVTEQWDLAMSPGSVTGLLSWLEAAPPVLNRQP